MPTNNKKSTKHKVDTHVKNLKIVKKHWSKRLFSFVFGMPIFILGLVITPIPPPFPPGWPVALLGLWILSFGFDWAEKRRHQLFGKIKKLWDDAMAPVREELEKQKKEK